MQNTRRLLLRVVGQRPQTPLFPALSAAGLPSGAAVTHASAPTATAPSPIWSHSFAASSAPDPAGPAARSDWGSGVDRTSSSNPVLQRYSDLLRDGSLQKDDQQLALVQQLARLYDDICAYKARMDEYHRAVAEHEARRLRRLQELLAEEAAVEAAAEEARRRAGPGTGSAAAAPGPSAAAAMTSTSGSGSGSGSSVLAGVGSWFRSAIQSAMPGSMAGGGRGGGGGAVGAGGDTPLARARRAAVRREERLDREMGPPPAAPEPPKGIYVWGSVGSGKSMLVAMFYQVLAETAQLPASRWMHFNAAMLEVHSRLHHLDKERWRQREERERLHHLHRQQQQEQHQQQYQERQLGPQAGPQAAQPQAPAHARAGPQGSHVSTAIESEDQDEEEEELEGEAAFYPSAAGGSGGGSGTAGAGDELPVPEHLQGVFRHWDPRQDPEVQRQKEAKAAMLAVRRHMRLARLGRHDPRTLAAANAQGVVRAAASFIRGRPGDPRSGWEAGSGPIASLLYFDEVQVTDVFSAVALKGLVEALTSAGCVLVCTSNRAPLELPRHGLHEDMWGHFVETLLQRCTVHQLSSEADYRRVLLEQGRASIAAAAAAAAAAAGPAAGGSGAAAGSSSSGLWPPVARSYILPAGPDGTAELERLWRARAESAGPAAGSTSPRGAGDLAAAAGSSSAAAVTGDQQRVQLSQGAQEQPLSVPVLFGRSLEVHRRSACGGAAWFSFPELCGRPLGPADYVALSQRFHTVFIEGIPAMSMQVRDQARRFITLVDELYNARCVLVASAEVPPEELFTGAEGQEPILDLEGLQFETAVEGARLRRDVTSGGGVAPVAASPAALAAAMGALGGAEERFAFRRAVSRLLEMQSPQYILGSLRMRQQRH